jgi:hypothetical protein
MKPQLHRMLHLKADEIGRNWVNWEGWKKEKPLIIKGFSIRFTALLRAKAVWTGLEPATSAVTGRHSNQLNYQTISAKTAVALNGLQM